MDQICSRCGASIVADSKGQYANANTLQYRCLQVGKTHTPAPTDPTK